MEKIIVTTDLSRNSRAAIRYAIHLAKLRKSEITFLHVYHVLPASSWSDQQYRYYIEHAGEVALRELSVFVNSIYRSMSLASPVRKSLVVQHNLDVVEGVVNYAVSQQASYICISTRGAGAIRKLFGTTVSKLITASPVPVLCIPSTYRIKPIKDILYASDMANYKSELKHVVAFAAPLKASIQMMHLSYPFELLFDKDAFESNLSQVADYPVHLNYGVRNTEQSLLTDVRQAVRKTKPSILAMFTHQDRSFFERMLAPGNAKRYAAHASVPLLSFPKLNAPSGKKINVFPVKIVTKKRKYAHSNK